MQCTHVKLHNKNKLPCGSYAYSHRVAIHVHVSYHCLWLRMARPRPSAPPIQTGSHQQAERCVETWTASAWWSSSCPSSEFHHLGPTALRERHQVLAISDTMCTPFLTVTRAHQRRPTHSLIHVHCQSDNLLTPFCPFPSQACWWFSVRFCPAVQSPRSFSPPLVVATSAILVIVWSWSVEFSVTRPSGFCFAPCGCFLFNKILIFCSLESFHVLLSWKNILVTLLPTPGSSNGR